MAQPATAISRFDLAMSYSEFSTEATQKKFIGLQVFPPVSVSQERASFRRINVESLLKKPEDTRRAPRSEYNRDSFEWHEDSYAVEEHGVEEVSDDAENEMYGDILRGEVFAVQRGVHRVLQSLEQECADAAFSTTTFTGALTTAVATAWSDKSLADPIADVDVAREAVKSSCGMAPNTVVMTDVDFISCIRSDRLEGLLKYDASAILLAMNGGADQEVLQESHTGLARLFNVERVLVGQAFKNTADDGQTASLARYWTAGRVQVCHVNDDGMNGDLSAAMPSIGRTIWSTQNGEPLPGVSDGGLDSLIFDEYREENVRGSVYRPRNKRQVKVLHPEAGHLLTGI